MKTKPQKRYLIDVDVEESDDSIPLTDVVVLPSPNTKAWLKHTKRQVTINELRISKNNVYLDVVTDEQIPFLVTLEDLVFYETTLIAENGEDIYFEGEE